MEVYMKFLNKVFVSLILILSLCLTGCTTSIASVDCLEDIPEYTEESYVVLNDDQVDLTKKEKESYDSYIKLSELDSLGRCGKAQAVVGIDTMPQPQEKRESIGMVKPSGWHTVRYDALIKDKYLYNRCHLLMWGLTGLNAEKRNLITGTRYLNIEGMLPFEQKICDYIEKTDNHVFYRVTPIYVKDELVARGVEMEAYSLEDQGKGLQFHVYCYNVQPGVTIDYKTGDSFATGTAKEMEKEEACIGEIRGNKRSKVYHCEGQRAYEDMKDSKNLIVFGSEKEAKEAGFRQAKN